MEEWRPLRDYPGYSASNLGRIRNDKFKREVHATKLKQGRAFVGLMLDGVQVKRSLSKIIGDAFLDSPMAPHFTTPIHFDGDLSNCRVDNLDWRPRWFAIKHAEQFRREFPRVLTPVRDISTGAEFEDSWAAMLQFGLLYFDIVAATNSRTYVFPTMQSFEWVE